MSLEADVPVLAPRYARFPSRLRGIMIDWILSMILLFGALLVASAMRSNHSARTLGIVVVIVLVLYEPVLVSLTGGTLGHYLANLRVVDERDQGNVSFLKALARFVLKGLLGWYSFIVMAATRRNQSMHDLLTRSTVQIRDPAKARPNDYITERSDFQSPDMPPRPRRVTVICVYLMLAALVYGLVLADARATGMLSPACMNNANCSEAGWLLNIAVALIWIAASAACVSLGWRGKLLGARRRS
jgi:uncharacterized RDD family membrane protein YckC